MAPTNPTADALKHARRRGQILEVLKSDYPHSIDFRVMRSVLNIMGTSLLEDELEGYLKYLENDGYIKIKRNDNHILYIELENKGMNLLDGFIEDITILTE